MYIWDQYSCQGCNCFAVLRFIWIFCFVLLESQRTHTNQALKVKVAKPVTSGTYSSSFDYCAGRCRHNSESVVQDNAYLSVYHHCFAPPSNSLVGVSDMQMEVQLIGINVMVGKQGESCDSVCKSVGRSCVANTLSWMQPFGVIIYDPFIGIALIVGLYSGSPFFYELVFLFQVIKPFVISNPRKRKVFYLWMLCCKCWDENDVLLTMWISYLIVQEDQLVLFRIPNSYGLFFRNTPILCISKMI